MNMATKFLVTVLFIGAVCANVGARLLDEVPKELMDQNTVSLPQLPGVPGLPQLLIPPMPSVPAPPFPGGEAAFATKGGRLENGEVRVPKETKVGISNAKTATTNGLGSELSTVIVFGDSFGRGTGKAKAAAGPNGPRADSTGTGSNSGYVIAEGPYARGNVDTISNGAGGAGAAAGTDGAIGVGSGNGGGYIYAGGYAGN